MRILPQVGWIHTLISVERSYILHTLSTQDEYTHVHTTFQTRHTHTTYIPSTQGKYIYILLHHVYLCVLHRGNAYLYVCFLCGGVVYVRICMSYLEFYVFPNTKVVYTCVIYLQVGVHVCMCIQHGRCVYTHLYVYTTLQVRCPCAYTQITTSMYNTNTFQPQGRVSYQEGVCMCGRPAQKSVNILSLILSASPSSTHHNTELEQCSHTLHEHLRYSCIHAV